MATGQSPKTLMTAEQVLAERQARELLAAIEASKAARERAAQRGKDMRDG